MVERFLQEGKAAARIQHPNVCPIYDAGCSSGTYFLVMALIEGESLTEWMQQHPPAPEESAELIRKLAVALQVVHDQGIVHRDIKPSNVMVTRQGEPLLMDFGLARRLDGASGQTASGVLVGTIPYMSPEQVNGEPADRRSDVYSLGVVFYQLLAGQLPFQGKLTDLLVAHRPCRAGEAQQLAAGIGSASGSRLPEGDGQETRGTVPVRRRTGGGSSSMCDSAWHPACAIAAANRRLLVGRRGSPDRVCRLACHPSANSIGPGPPSGDRRTSHQVIQDRLVPAKPGEAANLRGCVAEAECRGISAARRRLRAVSRGIDGRRIHLRVLVRPCGQAPTRVSARGCSRLNQRPRRTRTPTQNGGPSKTCKASRLFSSASPTRHSPKRPSANSKRRIKYLWTFLRVREWPCSPIRRSRSRRARAGQGGTAPKNSRHPLGTFEPVLREHFGEYRGWVLVNE